MSTTEIETTETDALFERAMQLPPKQRLALSERLILSVPPPGGFRTDEEWDKEIERRVKEFEADPSIGIPAEEVMAEARRIANEDV